jgi:hypothetical protein
MAEVRSLSYLLVAGGRLDFVLKAAFGGGQERVSPSHKCL